MPKFCANLTLLFTELPFLERFAAAKAAGFNAVEVLFPYDEPPKLIARQLLAHDLTLALINCPPPNYTGGQRGFAAVPELAQRFRRDFARTLRYAQQLRPVHIHIMAGVAQGDMAQATFIENLKWAAKQAPDQSLTIEPINQTDMPGYFLSDFQQASDILQAVAAPNVTLQYDAYHAQMITGDAAAVWAKYGHLARHIQVGGFPGRHEPSGGDIDYPAFFEQLDRGGYSGFVSGEYHPAGRTQDGLGWIAGPACA